MNYSTNCDTHHAGQSTANDTSGTLAAILQWTSAPAVGQTLFHSSGSSAGVQFGVQSTTNFRVTFPGGGTSLNPTTAAIAISIPYFVVMSFKDAGGGNYTANVTITNLSTGVSTQGTATSASTGPIAQNGTYIVGNVSGAFAQLKASVSAIMFSNNFLSLSQQQAFAFDPWSFWYPNQASS